jgi:predicted nucleic acid-binding protein
MSAAFVVDCSITMAWLFHDEATPKTAALLTRLATETALAPAWWFIEITNVLAMAERKGRITPIQSDAFVADLGKLGIERGSQSRIYTPPCTVPNASLDQLRRDLPRPGRSTQPAAGNP